MASECPSWTCLIERSGTHPWCCPEAGTCEEGRFPRHEVHNICASAQRHSCLGGRCGVPPCFWHGRSWEGGGVCSAWWTPGLVGHEGHNSGQAFFGSRSLSLSMSSSLSAAVAFPSSYCTIFIVFYARDSMLRPFSTPWTHTPAPSTSPFGKPVPRRGVWAMSTPLICGTDRHAVGRPPRYASLRLASARSCSFVAVNIGSRHLVSLDTEKAP